MKKQLFKVNKGLEEYLLDLYNKYEQLSIPFTLENDYEHYEFVLETMFKDNDKDLDKYQYIESLHLFLGDFKAETATLYFYWDVLVKYEIHFILHKKTGKNKSSKELVDKALELENLLVIETKEGTTLKYSKNQIEASITFS